MPTEGARITRNTVFFIAALVGQKILTFFYFAMIARVMGVEDTGRYFLATSFTLLFSVIGDFGFAPFLVREAAKLREGVSEKLRTILGAKILLSGVLFFVINGTNFFLPYPPLTKLLIFLASLSVILESWHLTFYALLRGWQRLEYEAMGLLLGYVFIVGVGTASLFLFPSLPFLIALLIIGNAANVLWAFFFVRRTTHLSLSPSFALPQLRHLFVLIIPFALAAVFTRVTGFIDTFLLSLLGTETMVGLYSVPFKVTFALQFIPLAFSASLLPAMSSFAKTSTELLAKTFTKGSLYLLFIVLPVAFGIAALADQIIPTIFGEQYSPAIVTQRLLILSLVFLFLNFPIGAFLVATDRQNLNTTFLGVTMIVNILLNLFFIPRVGILGPAIASVGANAFLFVAGLSVVVRAVSLPFHELLYGVAKAVLSVTLMVFAVFATKAFLNLGLVIVLGAVVYCGGLLLLRAVTRQEIREALRSLTFRAP